MAEEWRVVGGEEMVPLSPGRTRGYRCSPCPSADSKSPAPSKAVPPAAFKVWELGSENNNTPIAVLHLVDCQWTHPADYMVCWLKEWGLGMSAQCMMSARHISSRKQDAAAVYPLPWRLRGPCSTCTAETASCAKQSVLKLKCQKKGGMGLNRDVMVSADCTPGGAHGDHTG